MKRAQLLALLLLTPYVFASVKNGQNLSNSRPKPPSHPKVIVPAPVNVSVINLIATPEKYDGKIVAVDGFLAVESEDARLYLSQDDYRHNIMDNGIFIDANKEITQDIESKDLHYVQVAGVFKLKGLPRHYPGGAGEGGITDIRQCGPLPESTDTPPRKPKEP